MEEVVDSGGDDGDNDDETVNTIITKKIINMVMADISN